MSETTPVRNTQKATTADSPNLDQGPALVDRAYRGLIEITGKDRVGWLHNLTTNQVKTLQRGQGNYAFALNVQGRILFDLNILVLGDRIRLDLDQRFLTTATTHFEKYIITDDVTLTNRTSEFVRLALVGERAVDLLSRIGLTQAIAMPILDHTSITWQEATIHVCRSDFCGCRGFDLWTPGDAADRVQAMLLDDSTECHATRVDSEAVQIRRIEAGIPWPGREIAEDVLPAETGQFERAVNINKGCYLGQEVVERMRSRGGLARRLVGLRIDGPKVPAEGAAIQEDGGAEVGTVTSSCTSKSLDCVIGLGYIKTAFADEHTRLVVIGDGTALSATVVALPFVAGAPR